MAQSSVHMNVGVFEKSNEFEATTIAYNVGAMFPIVKRKLGARAQFGQEHYEKGKFTNVSLMASVQPVEGPYSMLLHTGVRYNFDPGSTNPVIGVGNIFHIAPLTHLTFDIQLTTSGTLRRVDTNIQAMLGVMFVVPRSRKYKKM